MLSLVVIAQDEAGRVEACLASAPRADERVVVDGGSRDDTAARAGRAGARVVHAPWPGHVAQKNRALDEAGGDWILCLDADERLAPGASYALAAALERAGDAAGFSLVRRNRWLGHELRHGRFGRERKVRVVRRGRGRWVGPDPHDRLVVEGPVVALDLEILHDPYRDLSEHLATIDRYSLIGARALAAGGRRCRAWDLALRPPLHFVDAYLLRAGFLDGLPGLAVASLGALHVLCKWARLRWEVAP